MLDKLRVVSLYDFTSFANKNSIWWCSTNLVRILHANSIYINTSLCVHIHLVYLTYKNNWFLIFFLLILLKLSNFEVQHAPKLYTLKKNYFSLWVVIFIPLLSLTIFVGNNNHIWGIKVASSYTRGTIHLTTFALFFPGTTNPSYLSGVNFKKWKSSPFKNE